jgi:hypothetical protein
MFNFLYCKTEKVHKIFSFKEKFLQGFDHKNNRRLSVLDRGSP